MRKLFFSTVLLTVLFLLGGCSKNNEIDSKNIQNNTMLVKEDGSIEAATVEAFDKSYYDITELDAYVGDKVNQYNTKKGAEAITKKSLELKESDVVLVLTYVSVEDYNSFNGMDAGLITTAQAKEDTNLLSQNFTAVKKGKPVTVEKALENKKYKVLILKENLDVLLQGTIKYYSGGTLVDKHRIQTAAEGSTVIVYKP